MFSRGMEYRNKFFPDSGTQFHHLESSECQPFAKEWEFSTFSSSPQYHQANGTAEASKNVPKEKQKHSRACPPCLS